MKLSYIAGMIDSDGNVDLSYRKRSDGFALFPKITIAQKHKEVLVNIYNNIKKGYIYKNKSCYIYELNSQSAVDFAKYISQYIIIKKYKIDQLTHVDINKRYTLPDITIIIDQFKLRQTIYHNTTAINNVWMAGFIDGDGSFLAEKNPNTRGGLRFRLSITQHSNRLGVLDYICSKHGGFVRKMHNMHQWTCDLNRNLRLLIELIPHLYIKKPQALLMYYWINQIYNQQSSDLDMITVYNMLRDAKITPFNFDIYNLLAHCTAQYPPEHGLSYAALGLNSEAGEVASKVKKLLRGDKNIDVQYIMAIFDEMADVAWYLSECCTILNKIMPSLNLNYHKLHMMNLNKLFQRTINNTIKGEGDNR